MVYRWKGVKERKSEIEIERERVRKREREMGNEQKKEIKSIR